MDILREFGIDPSILVLGSLCKRGHDFEGTGKSLRYIIRSGRYKGRPGTCAQCKNQKWEQWKIDNLERYLESNKRHYWENRQKHLERSKQYYQEHREERIAYSAEWESRLKQDNPERYKRNRQKSQRNYRERHGEGFLSRRRQRYQEKDWKYYRDRYKANRDKILESQREYRSNNLARHAISEAKRRARKKGLGHHPYTPSDLDATARIFSWKCAYCDSAEIEHWDHFIPLSKGGPDSIDNLIPACQSCNVSKHAQDPCEWFRRQPFYSQEQWQKILKALGKVPESHQ